MRALIRASVLVVSLLASGLTVVGTPQAANAAVTALYPDLQTLPPRNLQFDYTDVSDDGSGDMHHVLRFSNTEWNAGPGPLELRAKIDPTTQDGTAYQRVYNTDGTYTDYPAGRIYYHAVHNHYHYDGWGSYQLWDSTTYSNWLASGGTTGQPLFIAPKTSSCAIDEEFVADVTGASATPQYPWTGCMPDSNGNIREGLAAGWGDTYDYYRFEQWIDLGSQSLADGHYTLVSTADPNNQLRESPSGTDPATENNNVATTSFTVQNGAILDGGPPTGTVAINGIDTTTSSPSVTVTALGRDDVSGVDQIRLSNDNAHWVTMSYTGVDSTPQSVTWDLTDPATGGTTSSGTKTVYVQFHDRAGNWSTSFTDSINYQPCTAQTRTSAYSSAVTGDSPVSYWRLDDNCQTAYDVMGRNTGTYVNGVTTGTTGLLAGDPADSAAGFNGGNYVRVPNSSSLGLTGAVSLEAWIKPAAIPAAGGWASIVSKPEAYSLQFNGPRLEFTIIQNGTRRRLQAPSGAVSVGNVYHVVGTYDGTTQRLYLNGKQVASAALTGAVTNTSNGLNLASWDGNGEYYKGVIDDVAVYGKALSATRVAAHYSAGSTAGSAVPAAPTGLKATAINSARVDLQWVDNSSNESNFELQRATSSAFSSPTVFSLPANIPSYSDTGLSPSTTYYYRVRATNSSGQSAWSGTVSATTPAVTGSAYRSAVLGDQPVSYWRLGDTSSMLTDETATNPGSYVGSPSWNQSSLVPSDPANTAVGFSGSGQYAQVPDSTSLDLSPAMSLEAWIKPASLPASGGWATVITKQESYSIQFNGPRIEFTLIQNGVRERLDAPAGAVVAGNVYHVVATWDGSTQRLYLNGTQVASQTWSGTPTVTTSPVRIASWDGNGEYFNGVIDEVAVYKSALSATQVAAHYSAGTG